MFLFVDANVFVYLALKIGFENSHLMKSWMREGLRMILYLSQKNNLELKISSTIFIQHQFVKFKNQYLVDFQFY